MNKFGQYSKKVIKRFKDPHNYGRMENPDGLGKVGNPVCGDVMWLYIKVSQNEAGEEVLEDVKFETFGCVAAISTSSIVTDIAKGKTIDEAININKDEVVESLDGLPPIKMHCSMLAVDALIEAIYDYLSKNKKPISKKLESLHRKTTKTKTTHKK